MDFMQEYEKWLHSPALSPEEHAELESIKDDPKEIESLRRDYDALWERTGEVLRQLAELTQK